MYIFTQSYIYIYIYDMCIYIERKRASVDHVMYICMYVCMYVRMYVCMYVGMSMCAL